MFITVSLKVFACSETFTHGWVKRLFTFNLHSIREQWWRLRSFTDQQVRQHRRRRILSTRSPPLPKKTLAAQRTWLEGFDMEFAALVALSLLLGALVILVAFAVGRRKEELNEEIKQAEEFSGNSHTS